MRCFICRQPTTAQVIRKIRSASGPGGWGRICVPCAIHHDLDGVLLAPPEAKMLVELWRTHLRVRGAE